MVLDLRGKNLGASVINTVRVLVPVLHRHFTCSNITFWGIFEERHIGIEILSLSSFDVKSGLELPILTSV